MAHDEDHGQQAHQESVHEQGLSSEELEAQEGATLPDREAMSLIGTPGLPALPDTSGLVVADASATEGESVTDGDRSETFSASDSAYAGPS